MAEILLLKRWQGERQRRRSPEIRIGAAEKPFQLLLFTGVRYERLEDGPQPQALSQTAE